VARRVIVAPSDLPAALAGIIHAVAKSKGEAVPAVATGIEPTEAQSAAAASLLEGKKSAIVLGNYALQHPEASQLHALANMLATMTGATLAVPGEAANSVGAHIAGALPQSGGMHVQAMLADPRKAYVLLHAEPEFDFSNPPAARAALDKAELVVVMSPFKHGTAYADVLLPIAPFSETAGTFINCEGRVQGFHGVVKALGETRPGWKVLRVLGTMLNLEGFDADTAAEVRSSVLGDAANVAERLSNATSVEAARPAAVAAPVERVADVPIYAADPIVRRSPPLQLTADARSPKARMHRSLFDSLGLGHGGQVKVTQGAGEAVLSAVIDPAVPPGVVRIAAAHPSTCGLEGLSGPITVERV
jgi:NADH-quinone oxidoreductase subunit G